MNGTAAERSSFEKHALETQRAGQPEAHRKLDTSTGHDHSAWDKDGSGWDSPITSGSDDSDSYSEDSESCSDDTDSCSDSSSSSSDDSFEFSECSTSSDDDETHDDFFDCSDDEVQDESEPSFDRMLSRLSVKGAEPATNKSILEGLRRPEPPKDVRSILHAGDDVPVPTVFGELVPGFVREQLVSEDGLVFTRDTPIE